jgi:hypothetical protein
MKRLLSFAFALVLLGSAAPAFAQQYDRHGYYRHDPHYYAHRDYRYVAWQQAPRRYRYWHGRQVTYYNNAWGYWGYQRGLHVFISVPL